MMDTKDGVPVPVKFQMDLTGLQIMAYSEDRETVFALTQDPAFILQIESALGLRPMTKAYAMAHLTDDGALILGDKLPTQDF